MEKTLEEYRRLLPAAEKYTYMNSAGCGPLSLPVLERMEGVFRRMALEGQVNVEIHGWIKEMLEEIRKELNFTTLKYHRLDDLTASIDIEPCKLCTYCWSGKE